MTRPIGGGPAGGGGAGGVQSVNGDTGPNVILAAGDVGADPAGTAAAAIVAHEAAADPHTVYLLADGTRALAGNLSLGGNDLTSAGAINGVTLTAAGSSADFLNASGAYVAIADENDLTWSFSRQGNVSSGSPLNMPGGLACNSAARRGMKVTRDCTLTKLGWHRSDADVGELLVEVYRGGAVQASATVAVPVSTPEGTGTISISVLENDLIAVYVSSGSPNTLSNVVARVLGEA